MLILFFFVIQPQSDPARGQVKLRHKLIANWFKKGKNPCKQEFHDKKLGKQILDYYLTDISNITSCYWTFNIETLPSQTHQTPHRIQTDDIELELSKIS